MNWYPLSSNIDYSSIKDITPTNFQLPTRYPCIICYERCIEPLSCIQCKQIICNKHLDKIKNKCPNCRLSPFKFNKDQFLGKLTEHQLARERDLLITKATFTCLVQGCNFQGKYHKMDIHRRKFHRNEEMKDILFPEERQKKKRKEMLEKLFLKILIMKKKQVEIKKNAKELYDSSNKKVSLPIIQKMLWHVSVCTNEKCKKVSIQENMCFIGTVEKDLSECLTARRYIQFFDN